MNEHDIADPQDRLVAIERRRGFSLRTAALVLAAAVAAVAALLALSSLITEPTSVPTLNVRNDSQYDFQVSVGRPGGASSVRLGAAAQECTTPFSQVADQGASWELHFQAQGVDAGSVTVTREQLEASGWTATIPADAAQRLADQGVVLPPHRECGSTNTSNP